MAKGRKRLIAGWGLIGLGIAVTGVMVPSRWYFVEANVTSRCSVGSWGGGVHLTHFPPGLFSSLEVSHFGPINPPGLAWLLKDDDSWFPETTFNAGVICLRRGDSPVGPFRSFEIELWPVALVLLTLGGTMALSGRRAKRRARLGHCPACGYDLKGLASGTACPECGKGK